MKIIHINGVRLYVCSQKEAQEHDYDVTFTWYEETHGMDIVTITHLNKNAMMDMLGMDKDKADLSVPQPWADQHEGDWWQHVWYYGNPSTHIFGEPINLLTGMQGLASQVFEAMLASTEVPAHE